MSTHDNAPPPPGWVPTSKPWDAKNCCPLDCGVCETPQHSVFLHGADNVILGDN